MPFSKSLRAAPLLALATLLAGCNAVVLNPAGDVAAQQGRLVVASTVLMLLIIVPVIALTANAMPREVERGLALGFFRYLTKPINLDEFFETLESALALAGQRDRANT